ncbi:MAG: DUF938 domain-containing protein [Steroidobacteraceae bacterium]|nr:DUF938 domain-containing protein [Steroidobacteraceae bacterium]
MSSRSPSDPLSYPTAESPACERNRQPILERLRPALAHSRHVLEIGSGTGQHAVFFAPALPHLLWQASDRAEWLPGLRARIAREGAGKLPPPIELDVTANPWPLPAGTAVPPVDAVFTANTLHIMGWPAVEAFFAGVGRLLAMSGDARATGTSPRRVLAVYGPFRYRGAFTSASNAAFDATLRQRDPASGIRDFEAVDALAAAQGLALEADHAMPANNQLLLWGAAA